MIGPGLSNVYSKVGYFKYVLIEDQDIREAQRVILNENRLMYNFIIKDTYQLNRHFYTGIKLTGRYSPVYEPVYQTMQVRSSGASVYGFHGRVGGGRLNGSVMLTFGYCF